MRRHILAAAGAGPGARSCPCHAGARQAGRADRAGVPPPVARAVRLGSRRRHGAGGARVRRPRDRGGQGRLGSRFRDDRMGDLQDRAHAGWGRLGRPGTGNGERGPAPAGERVDGAVAQHRRADRPGPLRADRRGLRPRLGVRGRRRQLPGERALPHTAAGARDATRRGAGKPARRTARRVAPGDHPQLGVGQHRLLRGRERRHHRDLRPWARGCGAVVRRGQGVGDRGVGGHCRLHPRWAGRGAAEATPAALGRHARPGYHRARARAARAPVPGRRHRRGGDGRLRRRELQHP